MERIKVIGHRGAVHAEPENSLAGLRKAIALGADGAEFDVRCTRDGTPVLMHDLTLDRTTSGNGPVSRLTFAELEGMTLANGERIQSVGDALDALADAREIHVDVKDAESALPACAAVFRMKMQDRVIFSSSCGPWLLGLKMKYPRARIAFSCGERRCDAVRIATSLRAEAVNLSLWAATGNTLEKAHAEGLRVYVWTADKPRHVRKCLKLGADGIFTNRLDIILPLLEKLA